MVTTAAVLGMGFSAMPAGALSAMAPYEAWVSPDSFYSGAMLELKRDGDVSSWITSELSTMKNEYNINTVNLYGLESFRHTEKLFDELKRLGMQAVCALSVQPGFCLPSGGICRILSTYTTICWIWSAGPSTGNRWHTFR